MTNITHCDLCQGEIQVTPQVLEEKQLILQLKNGAECKCDVTFVNCPHCGKSYAVIVDDWETKELLSSVKRLYFRKLNYLNRHKPVPKKLQDQLLKLNRKLDFKREQHAPEFNEAAYQLDGNTYQLDYRYHVR